MNSSGSNQQRTGRIIEQEELSISSFVRRLLLKCLRESYNSLNPDKGPILPVNKKPDILNTSECKKAPAWLDELKKENECRIK